MLRDLLLLVSIVIAELSTRRRTFEDGTEAEGKPGKYDGEWRGNMGSSKKSCSNFKGHFRIMWTAWSKKNFCNGILGQRTISVQIFNIFGCHQNHGY